MLVSHWSSCASASPEMRISGDPRVRVSAWTRPSEATVIITWLAALPVGLDQPRPHHRAVVAVMHVDVLEGIEGRRRRAVDIRTDIDDRYRREPAAGRVDAPALIGPAPGDGVAGHALRHHLAVDVEAARPRVHLDEL